MSLLELLQREGGFLTPCKNPGELLEDPDVSFRLPLFSATSTLSTNLSPKSSCNINSAGISNADSLLTPTSESIKGTYSDTLEAAGRDTIPSSVAEDTPNGSAYTLDNTHPKSKDSELESDTMIEPAVTLPVISPVISPLEPDSNTRQPTETNVVAEARENGEINNGLERSPPASPKSSSKPGPQTGSKSDYFLRGPEVRSFDEKVSNSSAILPSNSWRSTSHEPKPVLRASTEIPRAKFSFDLLDRAHPAQFHSLRRLSTRLRSSSKEKYLSSTDYRSHSQRSSAPGFELARMKSAIVTKRVQKKKDALEDDTFVLGNKITEGHQNFVMAYNMLTGIRVAVSRCAGVMRNLSDNDFSATKRLTFDIDGSELTPSSKYDFKFKDYSPAVFRELRSLFGIDQADYLMSITGKYILSELGSSGKSGSFFYYSRDYRFIIKTIHHSEHRQLRRILKDYYLHVKSNPNTMVSQFYGLHRIKLHGGIKRIHFLVMNNLFPPHRDIHTKYDLKGSTWGRYTRIPKRIQKNDDISSYTLKDLNWLERDDHIKFGPEKKKIFLEQLEADVKLLKKVNVMDYSLLLGIHDVRKGNSETVAKLSVFDPKSNLRAEVFKTNPRDIDRGIDLPTDVFPGRSKYIFYGHNGGIRATNENNEPVSEIYYLGIIDCLTNYSFKKRLETAWRSLSHSRSTISAVPAHEYGDRFLKFIMDGISGNKVKVI